MQPLKIKLFDCLDGDKLHSGTQHRLGNRFRVAEVILLSLRIRPDIPGRHQPRIVAECLELPTEVSALTRTVPPTSDFRTGSRCALAFRDFPLDPVVPHAGTALIPPGPT